jgi:hypothetical protein
VREAASCAVQNAQRSWNGARLNAFYAGLKRSVTGKVLFIALLVLALLTPARSDQLADARDPARRLARGSAGPVQTQAPESPPAPALQLRA